VAGRDAAMKVDRGPAPLERFKEIVFQNVFKELS
jgi:hypothetical protein